MSAPKQGLSPCALIKEKVYSLKEKRADDVRREVAWNQERNVGFGWESAVRARCLNYGKSVPNKAKFQGVPMHGSLLKSASPVQSIRKHDTPKSRKTAFLTPKSGKKPREIVDDDVSLGGFLASTSLGATMSAPFGLPRGDHHGHS
jgi:hypothetical protein